MLGSWTSTAIAVMGANVAKAIDAPKPSTAQAAQPPADDIRPIRGAVEIPQPEESNILADIMPYLAGLIVVLLVIGIVLWLKRRAEARRIPNLQHKAIQALEKSKKLISEEHSRDYSIKVSDIVREFIEKRFHLPATQRTTEEFISGLTQNDHLDLGPYRESLQQFLQQSDFGKFSGDALDATVMEHLHDAALQVVQSEAADKTNTVGS